MPRITGKASTKPQAYEYKPGMRIGSKGWKRHNVVLKTGRNMIKLGPLRDYSEKQIYREKMRLEERMTQEITDNLTQKANPSELASKLDSMTFREETYQTRPTESQVNPLQEALEMIKGFEDTRSGYHNQFEAFKKNEAQDQKVVIGYSTDEFQLIKGDKFQSVAEDMAYDVIKKTIAQTETSTALAVMKKTLESEPATSLLPQKQRTILTRKLQKKAKGICKKEVKELAKSRCSEQATTVERQSAALQRLEKTHCLVFAMDTVNPRFFHEATVRGRTLCEIADASMKEYFDNIHNVNDVQDTQTATAIAVNLEKAFQDRFVPVLEVAGNTGRKSFDDREQQYGEMGADREQIASFTLEIINNMKEISTLYTKINNVQTELYSELEKEETVETKTKCTELKNEIDKLKKNKNARKKAISSLRNKIKNHPSSDNTSEYMRPINAALEGIKSITQHDCEQLEKSYNLETGDMVPPGRHYKMDKRWAEEMKRDLRTYIEPKLTVIRSTSQNDFRWQADFNNVISTLSNIKNINAQLNGRAQPSAAPEILHAQLGELRKSSYQLVDRLAQNAPGNESAAIASHLRQICNDILSYRFDDSDTKGKKNAPTLEKALQPVIDNYQALYSHAQPVMAPASVELEPSTPPPLPPRPRSMKRGSSNTKPLPQPVSHKPPAPEPPLAIPDAPQPSVSDPVTETPSVTDADENQESSSSSTLETQLQAKIAEREQRSKKNTATDTVATHNSGVTTDEVKPPAPPVEPPPILVAPPAPDKAHSTEEGSEHTTPVVSKDETKTPPKKTDDDPRAGLLDAIRQAGGKTQKQKYKKPAQAVSATPKPSSDADITHEPGSKTENSPKKGPMMTQADLMADVHAKIKDRRTPLKTEVLNKLDGIEFYDSVSDLADALESDILDRHEMVGKDTAKLCAEKLIKLVDYSDEDREDQVDEILKMLLAPPA